MEKICISGPGGQGFTVQIKRKKFQRQSIFQLKQKIKRKSGIPANDQRLTHHQKELQSNKTFRSYGICPGSKIFLQDRRKASKRKAGSKSHDGRNTRSLPKMTSPDIIYSSNSNTIQDILQSSKQCTDRSRTDYGNTHLQSTPARIETRDTSSSRLGPSNEFAIGFERTTMNEASKMRYEDSDLLARNKQPNNTDILQSSKQCTDRSRTDYENTHLQSTTARIETRDTSSSRLGPSNEFAIGFERTTMNEASKMRYEDSDLLARNKQPNNTDIVQSSKQCTDSSRTDYGNTHLQSTTARIETRDTSSSRLGPSNEFAIGFERTTMNEASKMRYEDSDLLSRNKQPNNTDILQSSKQCTDRSRTDYGNTHLQSTTARIETRDTSSSRLGPSNEFAIGFERTTMNEASKMRYEDSDLLARNKQPNNTDILQSSNQCTDRSRTEYGNTHLQSTTARIETRDTSSSRLGPSNEFAIGFERTTMNEASKMRYEDSDLLTRNKQPNNTDILQSSKQCTDRSRTDYGNTHLQSTTARIETRDTSSSRLGPSNEFAIGFERTTMNEASKMRYEDSDLLARNKQPNNTDILQSSKQCTDRSRTEYGNTHLQSTTARIETRDTSSSRLGPSNEFAIGFERTTMNEASKMRYEDSDLLARNKQPNNTDILQSSKQCTDRSRTDYGNTHLQSTTARIETRDTSSSRLGPSNEFAIGFERTTMNEASKMRYEDSDLLTRNKQPNNTDILQSSKQCTDRSRTEYGNTHLQSTTARIETRDTSSSRLGPSNEFAIGFERTTMNEASKMRYEDSDLLARNKQPNNTDILQSSKQCTDSSRTKYGNTHLQSTTARIETRDTSSSRLGPSNEFAIGFERTTMNEASKMRYEDSDLLTRNKQPNNTDILQSSNQCTDRSRTDYENTHLQSTTARIETRDTSSSRLGPSNEFAIGFEKTTMNEASKMRYEDSELLTRNKQPNNTDILQSSNQCTDRSRTDYENTHLQSTTARIETRDTSSSRLGPSNEFAIGFERTTMNEASKMRYEDSDLLSRNKQPNNTDILQSSKQCTDRSRTDYGNTHLQSTTARIETRDTSSSRLGPSNEFAIGFERTTMNEASKMRYEDSDLLARNKQPNNTDIVQSSKQCTDSSRTDYGNTHLQSTTARIETRDTSSSRLGPSNEFAIGFERTTMNEASKMRYEDSDLLSRNKQPNYTSSDRHIQQHISSVPRETNPLHHHTESREHNSQDRSMYYTKSPSEQYSEQNLRSRMHHIGNTRSNCNYPNNTTYFSDSAFQKRNKVDVFVPGKIISTHFYKELPDVFVPGKIISTHFYTPLPLSRGNPLMDQIQLNSGNIPVWRILLNIHDKLGSSSCCKYSILCGLAILISPVFIILSPLIMCLVLICIFIRCK